MKLSTAGMAISKHSGSTMAYLLDVMDVLKLTPSNELLQLADTLAEAAANLKIKVAKIAIEQVRA